jgi:hypothetical protein
MLYLGHFSFTCETRASGKKRQPWHGYLTAIAEAPTVAGALKKLEAIVTKSARSSELFTDVSEIFLESCVELKSVPRTGFVAHVTLEEGESLGSISTTLPDVDREYASSYHFEPNSLDADGGFDAEPFVVLKKKARAAKPKSKSTKKR